MHVFADFINLFVLFFFADMVPWKTLLIITSFLLKSLRDVFRSIWILW